MNNQSKIKYALNELIKGSPFNDIGEIFSKDYLSHVGEKQYRGHAIIKKWSKELNSTFSNLKVILQSYSHSTNQDHILVPTNSPYLHLFSP